MKNFVSKWTDAFKFLLQCFSSLSCYPHILFSKSKLFTYFLAHAPTPYQLVIIGVDEVLGLVIGFPIGLSSKGLLAVLLSDAGSFPHIYYSYDLLPSHGT